MGSRAPRVRPVDICAAPWRAPPGERRAWARRAHEDGSIVVAGGAGFGGTAPAEERDFAVARYQPNGTLDTTFGSAGIVTTDFAARNDAATGVAVLDDGSILAAGRATVENEDFALARYKPDGTLDDAFGSGGTVVTDLRSGNEGANAVAVQGDGRIIAVGVAIRDGEVGDFALVRYQPDGSLDRTFGSGGTVLTATGSLDTTATAVALQEDGNIIVAGFAREPREPAEFAVVRYLPDGSLDPSFGAGGTVTTDFGPGAAAAYGVAVQEDGKIVAAGGLDILRGDEIEDREFALTRYKPDGTLDSGFGSNERVITDFGFGIAWSVAVAIQEDGRIVSVGAVVPGPTEARFALARYNPDGALDRGFGLGGRVTTDFGPGPDEAWDLAIGDEGIVVVGSTSITPRESRFALARYVG
jgi:uncharacterized delta-60 repeat protein